MLQLSKATVEIEFMTLFETNEIPKFYYFAIVTYVYYLFLIVKAKNYFDIVYMLF